MNKKRKYSVAEADVASVKAHSQAQHKTAAQDQLIHRTKLHPRKQPIITATATAQSEQHGPSTPHHKKAKLHVNSSDDDANSTNSKTHVHSESVKQKKQASSVKHTKKHDKVQLSKRPKKWKKSKDKPISHSRIDPSSGSSNTADTHQTEKVAFPRSSQAEKVAFPRSSHDISANWKQFQKTFNIKERKKRTHTQKPESLPASVPDGDVTNEKPDIWFDDVDEVLIEASRMKPIKSSTTADNWDSRDNPLVKSNSFSGVTKIVAMDCEMVGTGYDGKDSILARVSIVNQYGQCIYDKLVQATDKVTDYRTQFSGIRPGDLDKGEEYRLVQKEVDDIIKGRVLIGHAIQNDLKVLFLDHPRKAIRDTSKYKPFRKLFQGRTPSLKKLSDQVLGVKVQEGEHNSIQDAQAAMRLYTMYRKTWEKDLKLRRNLRMHTKIATRAESNNDNMASIDRDDGD